MEKENVKALLAKYNEGLADPSEIKMLESCIERGEVELSELRNLSLLDDMIARSENPAPPLSVDDGFYAMLAKEKRSQRSFLGWRLPSMSLLMPRIAFASVLIIAGFVSGYLLNQKSSTSNVNQLTQEITDLKEMVMLSLLEKESATDRLKAVNLTSEMNKASQTVTLALLKTLNTDDDVNVRLAALDALKPYLGDGRVREGLVKSISHQDSPLVQIALAQLMVALQEKKSVDELQKIVQDDRTPQEVKNRIKESIEVII